MRRNKALAIAVCGVGLITSAPVYAQQVKVRAKASAGGQYSTNPFLSEEDKTSAGAAYVQLDPTLQFSNETLALTLNGSVRVKHYTRLYDDDFMARVGLGATSRFSERLVVSLMASGTTSRSAAVDAILSEPSIISDDGSLPEFPVIDPTEAGRRGRITGFSGASSAEYALTPTSFLTAGASVLYRTYDKNQGNYRSGAFNIGYSRQFSERLSANGSLGFNKVDYSTRFGGATVISPAAGVDWRLNKDARLEARLGVDLIRSDVGPSVTRTKAAIAGSLRFCDEQLGGSLCLSVKRSASPTGFSGVNTVTSAGLGYSRRIGKADDVSISAHYVHSNQNRNNTAFNDPRGADLLGGWVRYNRRVSDRLDIFVRTSATKSWRKPDRPDPNVSVMIGLSLAVGDRF